MSVVSYSNTNPHREPALEQNSTPTFERVLAVFENDTGDKPFDLAHVLVLTRLKRAAGEHYARVLDAMLAREDSGQGLGIDLVRGAQMLFRRIADALGQVALRMVPRPQLVDQQSQIAEIALSAFLARGEEIKWHSFDHTRPPARSWQRTNSLMRAIESIGLEKQQTSQGMSCIDGFARCMLIDSLNVGILEAPAMELAQRWIGGNTRDLHLEPFFDSDTHGYQVDLGSSAGPERITPSSAATDFTRYLKVAALGPHLANARAELYAGKLSVGAAPNRAVALHFGAFLDVAERLWSPDWRRATWREEREEAAGQSVRVVVGVGAVLQALRSDQTGAPLATEEQIWHLNDRSASGLGARLPLHMEGDAPLGALIAFREDEESPWEIGNIVRRIRAAEDLVWVVGVRRLCDEPVAIDLDVGSDQLMLETEAGATPAIYAPINADAGRIDGLIVPPEILVARSDFLLPTRGGGFKIRANRVIDRGADWVRFGFEVLGKK